MKSAGSTHIGFWGKYRIVLISVCAGLVIASVLFSVWLNVKADLDRSNYYLIKTEAGKIHQQITSDFDAAEVYPDSSVSKSELKNRIPDIIVAPPGLHVNVIDEEGNIILSEGEESASQPEYVHTMPVDMISGIPVGWNLEVSNSARFRENSNFRFIYYGLIIAMCLSVLLSVSVYSVLSLNQKSKELKVLNAELVKERVKAEKASQAKTEFLSNMSHEIRTPISVIMGFLMLIKNEKLSEEQKKYVQLMETSSKSLLSIVNDILEVDKIEAGQVNLAEERFSPAEEIKKMVDIQRPLFDEKGLYLKLNTPEECPFVTGDPNKFHQISTNLIRNVFKFTEKGGLDITLKFTGNEKKTELDIWFRDTGIGISPDKLQGIFDRFSQVDSSMKRKYEGTGLGLAITMKLAEVMGGTIDVKSTEGNGTTFHVYLVFKPASELPDSRNLMDEVQEYASYPGKKVLVVDDLYANIILVTRFLEHYQITSEYVESGKEAVEKVIKHDYDLIFMDVHMPEMDGLEATRQIRSLGIDTPIIGFSADITPSAVAEAAENGMDDYAVKPFTKEKMEEIFQRFLVLETDG